MSYQEFLTMYAYDITRENNAALNFLQGLLLQQPAANTKISISVSNELSTGHSYRSVCGVRGTVDTDKFVLVGSHHDEAGSGSPNPATGQAILREMMRLLTAYSG